MLKVVFVGDDQSAYPLILQNRIEINQTNSMYDAQIVLITDDTREAENYLCEHSLNEFFVILDLRLPGAFECARIAREQVQFMTLVVLDKDDSQLKRCVQAGLEITSMWQEPVVDSDIQNELDIAYKKYLKHFGKYGDGYFVSYDNNNVKRRIKFVDVLWAEVLTGKNRHILLHEKSGVTFELHMNLKKMEGYTDDFFRISRSVLVNLQNITYLDKKNHLVYMENESVGLEVSGRKIKKITDSLK
ncbi:LytTR family DNA-binding domain-containing protein [Ligilactobacillus murinus]|uniref:LytTR family DNA-binding domain-containing protein n=1 Tax=Ligilactobacillus murinus TaxID=1622 RepID=UPI0013A6B6C7|nr:LytTR family DNA-binding domain-containing protein [Ligilactobacillus murinus]